MNDKNGNLLPKPYKQGSRTLYIMSLEISKTLRNDISCGPMSLVYTIFEYIKKYAKENNFVNIICGAKNRRVAKLYERAGFKNLMPYAETNIIMEYKL